MECRPCPSDLASAQALRDLDLPPSQLGYPEAAGPDNRLDALKYLDLVLKHRRLLLVAAALSLCFGAAVNLLTTPLYRASTTIQIDRETAKVVDVHDVQAVEGGSDLQFYQTQFELLRSRALAQRVVADLALAEDRDMLQVSPPSPWAKLWQLLFHRGGSGGGEDEPSLADRQKAATFAVMNRASRSSRSRTRAWRASVSTARIRSGRARSSTPWQKPSSSPISIGASRPPPTPARSSRSGCRS